MPVDLFVFSYARLGRPTSDSIACSKFTGVETAGHHFFDDPVQIPTKKSCSTNDRTYILSLTKYFCNLYILLLCKMISIPSTPDHVCWGPSNFIFTSKNPFLSNFLHESEFRLLQSARELGSNNFICAVNTQVLCSTLQTIPLSFKNIGNVLTGLQMHFHPCSWKMNGEDPVDMFCCTWKLIVFSGQAQPYSVPLFTFICLANFNIKLCQWGIGDSRTWERPSTSLEFFNSW